MEESLPSSSQLEFCIEDDDTKYITGLSTILVATIQEMKDRISQIEFIFCHQIFPNFQSKSRSWQIVLAEVRKAAEDKWKERESSFIHQIEELHKEKHDADKQIKHLTASLQLMEANYIRKEQLLDAQEAEKKYLLLKLDDSEMRKQVAQLQKQLRFKTEEVDKGKELEHELLRQIDLKNSEILDMQRKEKDDLELRKQVAELQECLRLRTEEVDAGKELQQHLLQQIDLKNAEILDEQKKKKDDLEMRKQVDELQEQLRFRIEEVDEGKDLQQQLLKQIDLKNNVILDVQKNKKDVVSLFVQLKKRYKKLSHQYDHLLTKVCPTPENKVQVQRLEVGRDMKPVETPRKNVEENLNQISEEEDLDIHVPRSNELMFGTSDDETQELDVNSPLLNQQSLPKHASTLSPADKSLNAAKSKSAEANRPLSSWRVTRIREEHGGADPHDDFLDTPMEDVRRNINKIQKMKVNNASVSTSEQEIFDNSDNEKKKLNSGIASRKRHISIPTSDAKPYKFVEPVRKKAERENLQGVECKQCKKFYDSVLPDGRGNRSSICEHHDGVSRHRYKYIPPMTPEGFWNIGFDSDM